jgi:uncharacterized protein (TIGR03083 family)
MATIRDLATQERSELADMLSELTPPQWSVPSLCAGWTVRQVVAHDRLPRPKQNWLVRQHDAQAVGRRPIERGSAGRLCRRHTRSSRRTGARRHEPSGAGALFGGRVALIECLIHQQDIRRPLGMPRIIATDRLRVSLDYARISPVIGGARRTRGIRLTATDRNWSAGRGPEVRGSGEALLLAMTGRVAHLTDELDGDGVAMLGD